MAIRSAVVPVVAFLAGVAAMQLWQSSGEKRVVAPDPAQAAASRASGPPPAQEAVPAPPQPALEETPPAAYSPGLPGTEFDSIQKRERVAVMRSRLEAEAVDPAWAATTESKLRELLAARPDFAVSSIECRSTLCEARLIGANVERSWFQWRFNRTVGMLFSAPKGNQRLVDLWAAPEQQGADSAAVVYMKFGSGLARPDLRD
jgi:hypothetical protein